MNIKDVQNTIEDAESLKDLAQAYGEIASTKIKKIRASVERNRIFFTDIGNLYALVKAIAAKRQTVLVKSKPTISLILTSNYGFYGSINSELINYFKIETAKIKTDRLVIGKTGVQHFTATKYFNDYRPLIFKSDLPSPEELKALAETVAGYNQVLVFYPELKSLLLQQPTFRDITQYQNSRLAEIQLTAEQQAVGFIFEPELQKTLVFFASQINTLLLEQTFLEAEAARTASRFIAMDQAQVEANKFIKKSRSLLAYTKRLVDNNRILENIAANRKRKYTEL